MPSITLTKKKPTNLVKVTYTDGYFSNTVKLVKEKNFRVVKLIKRGN